MIAKFIFAAAIAVAAPVMAQSPPKPLFASDDIIHVTIRGPISAIARGNRDGAAQAATLTVAGGDTLPITLTARGITRRKKDTCQFPPLRVDFSGRPASPSLFAGQKRLKLVTHCRESADFQQYLLIEYAAYRMYNLLTPLSFRARLAQVDYIDSDGRPVISRLGFFLEDLADVGRRNALAAPKVGSHVAQAALSPADAARFAMFEYFISNYDWSIVAAPDGENCCHNGKLLQAGGRYIPVPYDFDFSGLVDAPYASTPDAVPIPNARQRYYRGFCSFNAEAMTAAAAMRARQSDLLAVFDRIPLLDPRRKAKAVNFLSGFFAAVADDRRTAQVLRPCR